MNAPVAALAADAAVAAGDIGRLLLQVPPIAPETTVEAAAELLLNPEFGRMLCLPVVQQNRPLGTVSRYQLNHIFLRRFGRELYGHRPVARVMNARPLVVQLGSPLEDAAAYVTAHMGAPITEDFVIVGDDGRYLGMGIVLDLLSALQRRAASGAAQLAQAYAQLKTSQRQLVQSEKMASLGQMVAGVAHEINTPLGYVRNNVEMVRDVFAQLCRSLAEHEQLAGLLTDENADEQALSGHIMRCQALTADLRDAGLIADTESLFGDTLYGVDTIKELVVNLRNFSRLDQARVDSVSLNDCLDQTLVIAQHLLKDKVQVIKRYADLPPIRCSPSQINQVLLNLIGNAAQAIEHDQGKLLLRTECDGRCVRVHIQDNGKGIAPEHLEKIFDPFFTTKAVGQGTGLGLSISYQIVQAHGGSIQVVSKIAQGTKFMVSLPCSA
jgi:signal transduction histidine kinase